jgi:hypothetical protein
MLPVRRRRPHHRLGEVERRRIRRFARNASGQPLSDFLQQPAVAVRIFERNKGSITNMLGMWPADAGVDALKPATSPVCTVKYLARFNAVRD